MKRKMPKSLRKFIRKEKARIRREFLDPIQIEQAIKELYNKLNIKFEKENENSRNL